MSDGYYRFPTIHDETIVFVSEDDLWTVAASGGVARRLTSGLAEATYPRLSADGQLLAFTGREEGQPEVYLMDANGGPVQRLTYLGGTLCRTVNWTPDGQIAFANNARQPIARILELFTVNVNGDSPVPVNLGPVQAIDYGLDGATVIGRNIGSPARWKRYRGGTAGQLWVDGQGTADYQPLIDLDGNLAAPMWVGERIYFLSDHEGVGNLYSCLPDGSDLQRHTDHTDFYARNADTDGRRIVYHAGADIYLYDPSLDETSRVEISFHSPRTQRNRKFVDAARYLDSWALDPEGKTLAITSRGKAFTMANWDGAVLQHGQAAGPRYRLLTWLNDGRRLIAVSDEADEEQFVLLPGDGLGDPELFRGLDTGRPLALTVNPKKDQIAFSNHRNELSLLDLDSKELTIIDRGRNEAIRGFAWSPDGEWLAYAVSVSLEQVVIKLWQAAEGTSTVITRPVLRDVGPAFDPQGRYLYLISYREFNPVYDNLQFDLNFPRGTRPYLITLQADLPSPFATPPRDSQGSDKGDTDGDDDAVTAVNGHATEDAAEAADEPESGETDGPAQSANGEEKLRIDLDGIAERLVAFPVDEGRYGAIRGLKDGRVVYSRYPVEGALDQNWRAATPPAKGQLVLYDFKNEKEEMLVNGISSFRLSRDGSQLIYRAGNRLRVLKAGSKPAKDAGSKPGRKSGWVDLSRIRISVVPGVEWQQMLGEAWRLQRDHFWTPDMSRVDWVAIHERYRPLVERVASRSEFSDLVWEMQGELGTSHSYEMGGDYRPEPRYDQGYLGADLAFDANSGRWTVARIVRGDGWHETTSSPLARPGVGVNEGDRLLAINGRRLGEGLSPAEALVNLAGQEVTLAVAGPDDEEAHQVTVKTLGSEVAARYREWVENNRRRVHEATDGRVGYVHVPDMGPNGYSEFHRGYLAEFDRRGLIVDVRFNGGGHVSERLLEKLNRTRIAYVSGRWLTDLAPYPYHSVLGPMVALTNEYAGSDGDIFSHGFKLMGLGPLLGKRTWGGVIGINPRQRLADGTLVTQPEYSFWFKDVGWGVENYGTDPDIEVDNRPQDYLAGADVPCRRGRPARGAAGRRADVRS